MSRRARLRQPAIEAKRAAAWLGPDPEPGDDSEGGHPDATPATPARWYCVSRDGVATLCVDEEDARANARHCDRAWPASGPHRAAQLADLELLAKHETDCAEASKAEAAALRALVQAIADKRHTYGWGPEADAAIDAARLALGPNVLVTGGQRP